MKTIRRRAASPLLTWESAGPNQEYRVVIRNQETGERQAIYDGFRTECRLPPELRLTPDLLAFRVMARPVEDPDARFVRVQDYTPIPRLGDDYETPADDLLTGRPVKGASRYRLLVRKKGTRRPIVDLVRPEPKFLLPVGLLRDGEFEYDLLAGVGSRWRGAKGRPVTAQMIAAADARAARPVPLPAAPSPTIKGEPARRPPGRLESLAPIPREAPDAQVLAVVDVTAAPELAPTADIADIIRRQWWGADGGGAVESVALMLESHGLTGLFLLDVLAGEALGYDQLARIAGLLKDRGHGLGLAVNPKPWRPLSPALADLSGPQVLEEAIRRFVDAVGAPPQAAGFAAGALDDEVLHQARRLGLRAIVADRPAQLGLPAWMRWRTAPFVAEDGLAVLPASMILSTPAHDRDRVVRHALKARDPLAAGMADQVAAAVGGARRLTIARIEPLALLLRKMVRSEELAERWNLTIARKLPAWSAAGWERTGGGFPVLDERDEIRGEMTAALIEGLARSGLAPADPTAVFAPEALRAWAEPAEAFEPLVEQRRGPRLLRRSAVRRYDAAYRQALKVERA